MDQKEKSAQSRAKIIETAIRLFNEKSYEKTSVSAICRAGSIAKGQMYYYFENKEELYLEAVVHIYDCFAAHLQQCEPNPARSLEANLEAFFDAWLCFFQMHIPYIYFLGAVKYNAPQELSRQVLELRQTAIAEKLKPLLSRVFVLHFPEDGERCRIMTDFAWLVSEYVSSDIGLTQFKARPVFDDKLFAEQRELFRQIVRSMLYGCLPPELRPAGK